MQNSVIDKMVIVRLEGLKAQKIYNQGESSRQITKVKHQRTYLVRRCVTSRYCIQSDVSD